MIGPLHCNTRMALPRYKPTGRLCMRISSFLVCFAILRMDVFLFSYLTSVPWRCSDSFTFSSSKTMPSSARLIPCCTTSISSNQHNTSIVLNSSQPLKSISFLCSIQRTQDKCSSIQWSILCIPYRQEPLRCV